MKEIGKADSRQTKICTRPRLPFLLQGHAVPADDIHLVEGTGHGGKPGRQDNDIDLILDAGGHNALACQTLDRVFGYVDELHVRLVVDLIVTRIDAEAFTTEHIVGAQQVGYLWIVDNISNLTPRKLGSGFVGVFLEKQVAEGAKEWRPPVARTLRTALPVLPGSLPRRAQD